MLRLDTGDFVSFVRCTYTDSEIRTQVRCYMYFYFAFILWLFVSFSFSPTTCSPFRTFHKQQNSRGQKDRVCNFHVSYEAEVSSAADCRFFRF